MKQLTQFILIVGVIAFLMIVLLPNFPDLLKFLPVVTLVLTIFTLPIALKRLPNEPRKKIFLFYIGIGLCCGSRVLDVLFAVSVDFRLIIDIIGTMLLFGSFLIKSRKPGALSRTK